MTSSPEPRDAGGSASDRGRLFLLNESWRKYLIECARKRLRDQPAGPASASDIVQDVLIDAVDAEARGKGPAPTDADRRRWLGGILRHKISNNLRRLRVGVILRAEPADPGSSPSGHVEQKEERERLQAAFARLSPGDQELIGWMFDDGLTRKQIAEKLGVSAPYASQVCIRALRRWREATESASSR